MAQKCSGCKMRFDKSEEVQADRHFIKLYFEF